MKNRDSTLISTDEFICNANNLFAQGIAIQEIRRPNSHATAHIPTLEIRRQFRRVHCCMTKLINSSDATLPKKNVFAGIPSIAYTSGLCLRTTSTRSPRRKRSYNEAADKGGRLITFVIRLLLHEALLDFMRKLLQFISKLNDRRI